MSRPQPPGLMDRVRSFISRGLATVSTWLAAISARVKDGDPGWTQLSGGGPADRPWYERYEDLLDALEAWKRNFLIRQIVRLTTAYVVGDGIKVSSKRRGVDRFIQEFCGHPENRIAKRLVKWSDELVRAGEIFIALSAPNPLNGMSYVREIPASCVPFILCDENDYERPLEFHEQNPHTYNLEPKIWKSKHVAMPGEPLLLHFKINEVVGATRGESDLGPVLPVAERYTAWLRDRVDFNRVRTEMAVVDIEVEDDTQVAAKQKQYETTSPVRGSIYVHGRGERIEFPSANLQGWDASPDGRAQRLAVATAANIPLHFLAEGDSATRSTAVEMGDPTHRHYRMRQADLGDMLIELVTVAYERAVAIGKAKSYKNNDLKIEAEAPDISRADNEALAKAALTIVTAFGKMRTFGWITDEMAVRLSFKFAGEILTEEQITDILDWSEEHGREAADGDGSETETDEGGETGELRRNGANLHTAAFDAVTRGW